MFSLLRKGLSLFAKKKPKVKEVKSIEDVVKESFEKTNKARVKDYENGSKYHKKYKGKKDESK